MSPFAVFFIVWLGLVFVFSFVCNLTPMAGRIAVNSDPLNMTEYQRKLIRRGAPWGQRFFMFGYTFLTGLMFPGFWIVAFVVALIWKVIN